MPGVCGYLHVGFDGTLPHQLGGGVDLGNGGGLSTVAFLVAELGHHGVDVGEIEECHLGTTRVDFPVPYGALLQGDGVHVHRPVQVGQSLGPHRARLRRVFLAPPVGKHIEGHAAHADPMKLDPLTQEPDGAVYH